MINQNSEILNKLFFTELQMLVEKYNNIDEVTKKQIESIVTSLRDEELQSYLMRNMDKLLDILKVIFLLIISFLNLALYRTLSYVPQLLLPQYLYLMMKSLILPIRFYHEIFSILLNTKNNSKRNSIQLKVEIVFQTYYILYYTTLSHKARNKTCQ